MNDAVLLHRADFFGALGDPNRIRLVESLLQRKSASISVLAAPLAISRQAVAKHLHILEDAGLVHSGKRGREVVYTLSGDEIAVSAAWLAGIADHWERRLAVIKAAAEGGDDSMIELVT